jgi:hypothetical protein
LTLSAPQPTERASHERLLALLRAALPESDVASLMAQGAAMDRETATAEAMAVASP